MLENNLSFFKILIAISCFAYGALFLQGSTKDSARFFCGIGEIAIGFWAIFDELQNLVMEVHSLILIQTCIYICAEIATCSLVAYTLVLFSQKSYFLKDKIIKIYLIPFVLIIIAFAAEIFTQNHLFLRVPNFVRNAKYPAYNFPKTFVYYIHSYLCYAGIAGSIIFAFYTEIRHPKSNRSIIISYVLTAIFFLTLNLYKFVIENFYPSLYHNFPQLTSTFSYIVFSSCTFFTVYFHKKERNLSLLNGQIFKTSDFPILVFSIDHEFISANQSAFDFFKNYSIKPKPYQIFTKEIIEKYFIILGVPESFDSNNEYYLSGIYDKQLYHVRKTYLRSFRNKITGYYVMLSKMDIHSGTFANLERESQTDELTGCKKRKFFEQAYVKEMSNTSEPIIVVCTRIENLSELNEKIGLKKTDSYIMTFSNILKNQIMLANAEQKVCKDVFRIDGSIFAFMLSINDQKIIPDLFSSIKKECSRFSKNRVQPLLCATGYSVASNREYSATKMLQKSFENMLMNKQ